MELEWTRGHIIGQGSSSTVYLATTTAASAAAAAVKSAELSQSQHLQREAQILSSLSSPYIVAYKGQHITNENKNSIFNLFMEYMPSGTLSEAARRCRLREPSIRRYTRQVTEGLFYLHSRGLVHCDIKGSNILIDEEGVVKIGDFGFAKSVAGSSVAPVAGTPAFMSPEAARGEEQGFPCDVWALGCTVVEMASGSVPWANAGDPISVLYRVGHCGEVPEIPRFLSEEAKDFLGKCFMRDPRERWSASQLLNHPFLVGFGSEFDDDEVEVLKVLEGSNSCSPTSILEQGIWNSVEESESECPLIGNLLVQKTSFFGDSPNDRIKRLAALCSCDPNWNWDDGNWINARVNGNENEVEGCCIDDGSVAASNSVSDDNYVSSSHRIISGYFCEGFVKCSRDVSVVSDSLNFERGVAKMMLHPLTLDIL